MMATVCSLLRKSAACIVIGALAIASTPRTAPGLACPCFFPPGPFKTWVMLDNATLGLFDCTTGMFVGTVDLGGECNSIDAKDDCSIIFVGTRGNPDTGKPPGFCDIDCETLAVTERPLPAPPIPNGLCVKGDVVVIAMENGQVAFFNCVTGQMQFVTVGGGCNSLISKCVGNTVFVGTVGVPGQKPPGFCDIDCQTLEVVERPLPVPPVPNGFWLTPDDSKLWIMLQDFSVFVFDCANQQPIGWIPVGGACNSITGKCDGSSVFLGNVGGDVPQTFFPPAGFPAQGGAVPRGRGAGGNFVVDSFFDISFEAEIDIPGIGLGQMSEALGTEARGDGEVGRGDPQRDWVNDPTGSSVIPVEMVALSLQSAQPVQFAPDSFFDIVVELTPGQPGPGQVVGEPDLTTGDFPVLPVQSFFDVFFDITVIDPSGQRPPCTFRAETPIRLELDPDGPPLVQIPFACDWWRVPPDFPPVPFFNLDPSSPFWPPQIFVGCDRLCFPPPPPPKDPGVCDIDCATLQIIQDCPLPAAPIPCGIAIMPGDAQIWAAMVNGTVGAWDCAWNPINTGIPVGGGCTSITWKPDAAGVFVGTAGVPGQKPPGICDIDPATFEVTEQPTPGGAIPLPKGLLICQGQFAIDCDGDANGDGSVDANDASFVIFRLGTQPGPCGPGDVNGDGLVDINDLSYVIFRLGTCNPGGPC